MLQYLAVEVGAFVADREAFVVDQKDLKKKLKDENNQT